MGSMNCTKSDQTASSKAKRVLYGCIQIDDRQSGALSDFFQKVVTRSEIYGITAALLKVLGLNVYNRVALSSDMSLFEFIQICKEERPTWLTCKEWDRFAASVVVESRQDAEFQGGTMDRVASFFANSLSASSRSPNGTKRESLLMSPSFTSGYFTFDSPSATRLGDFNRSGTCNLYEYRDFESCYSPCLTVYENSESDASIFSCSEVDAVWNRLLLKNWWNVYFSDEGDVECPSILSTSSKCSTISRTYIDWEDRILQ